MKFRQDLAGSSGKCGDSRCGSPGAFSFSCGAPTDLKSVTVRQGSHTTEIGF